jgi:hypothetical protein
VSTFVINLTLYRFHLSSPSSICGVPTDHTQVAMHPFVHLAAAKQCFPPPTRSYLHEVSHVVLLLLRSCITTNNTCNKTSSQIQLFKNSPQSICHTNQELATRSVYPLNLKKYFSNELPGHQVAPRSCACIQRR